MHQKALLLTYCWLSFGTILHAQKMDSLFYAYTSAYPWEQVYLHLDNDAYFPGDTIWFKAYLRPGIEPTHISKNLYVDWIDQSDSLLAHQVFPVLQGNAFGLFVLPPGTRAGCVHVRAYTRWMLNFDAAFLFDKFIPLITRDTVRADRAPAVPRLIFFPEGGNATSGIMGKIAFIATDASGRPISITGVITDSSGHVTDSLVTRHDGMGSFYLQPDPGASYTAQWLDDHGQTHATALPTPKLSGVAMRVLIHDDSRELLVTRTDSISAKDIHLHVLATIHQKIVYWADPNLSEKNTSQGYIPIKDLPPGVMVVTLFDQYWTPLAERVTFIPDKETAPPVLTVEKADLAKRGRNDIALFNHDKLPSSFSLAITDASVIDSDEATDDIVSYLQLSGEIRGYIHNPRYYFSDANKEDLDLLMLTHGWRRYDWKAISTGAKKPLPFSRDSTYLFFAGKIDAPERILRKGGNIMLTFKSKGQTYTSLLPFDQNGLFADSTFFQFDTLRATYKLFPPPDPTDSFLVAFYPNKLQAPDRLPLKPPGSSSMDSGYFRGISVFTPTDNLFGNKVKALPDVVIKAKRPDSLAVLEERYITNPMIQNIHGYDLDLEHDPMIHNYQDFTFLIAKIPGLHYNGQFLYFHNSPIPVTFYLDGVEIPLEEIESMPLSQIAFLKATPETFLMSPQNAGSIFLYTKKTSSEDFLSDKNLPSQIIEGYSLIKECYSPDYSAANDRHSEPDNRRTLYWNPAIVTDGRHKKVNISFYNNDVSHAYRIVLEGMDAEGHLTHLERIISQTSSSTGPAHLP